MSPEWAERILSWRHTGFNVHSRVRPRTKPEAERVGKYVIWPVLALERVSFLFIRHLELTLIAEKPPPSCRYGQVILTAAASACTYGDV